MGRNKARPRLRKVALGRIRLGTYALLGPALLVWGQPRFERQVLSAERGIAGAALAAGSLHRSPELYTWGQDIQSRQPGGGATRLAAPPGAPSLLGGGCLLDADRDGQQDLLLQSGGGSGGLLWRQASTGRWHLIAAGVETEDLMPARLFGQAGVLLIHRFNQLRFYAVPSDARQPWIARELYSFYSPSRQGGLAQGDVDQDGFEDILCGNYWVRNPGSPELPWRLFAVNTFSEDLLASLQRLAWTDLHGNGAHSLVASEREARRARLTWFRRPADPHQLWTAHPLEGRLHLRRPQGLAVADLNGDRLPEIVVGENDGPGSRILVFWNRGGGVFDPRPVGEGNGALHLWAVDWNRDGKLDLLTAGPWGVEWWSSPGP
jgi:hypothetical protein